jgi:hypothetical protein
MNISSMLTTSGLYDWIQNIANELTRMFNGLVHLNGIYDDTSNSIFYMIALSIFAVRLITSVTSTFFALFESENQGKFLSFHLMLTQLSVIEYLLERESSWSILIFFLPLLVTLNKSVNRLSHNRESNIHTNLITEMGNTQKSMDEMKTYEECVYETIESLFTDEKIKSNTPQESNSIGEEDGYGDFDLEEMFGM